MIALNPDMWMIAYKDGQTLPFDPVRLKTELTEAFFLSGYGQHAWLADEMVSGVEFALNQSSKGTPESISEERLHELVAGLFAQTGYPEAAETYIQLQSQTNPNPPGSLVHVHKVLSDYFSEMPAELLSDLAQKTATILREISMVCPSNELVIEMAKNLNRQKNIPAIVSPVVVPQINPQKVPLTLTAILTALPADVQPLVSQGVLTFDEISRVFPVMNVRFDWMKFAHTFALDFPLTEMAVLPHFQTIADAITSARAGIITFHFSPETELPISLEMVASERFAMEALGTAWSEDETHPVRQMAQELAARVWPIPFKIKTLRNA